MSLPPFAELPRGDTVEDTMFYHDKSMAYHGSPFSPDQMAEVFARHGYPAGSWALVPQQAMRLNKDGAVEPYGSRPSISAGKISSAISRAFLHSRADHFMGIQNTTGFSSSGFIDSSKQCVAVVPKVVGETLAKHEPDGNLYRVDVSPSSPFKPLTFETEIDAIYDAGEYRAHKIIKPLGVLAISFAEYCDSQPVVVADCTLHQLNVLQRSLLLPAIATPQVHGATELVDYFIENDIKAQLLLEL